MKKSGKAKKANSQKTIVCCPKCEGPTAGWKCAICGVEARAHVESHKHVGSDRYCTLKCKGCSKADVHCRC